MKDGGSDSLTLAVRMAGRTDWRSCLGTGARRSNEACRGDDGRDVEAGGEMQATSARGGPDTQSREVTPEAAVYRSSASGLRHVARRRPATDSPATGAPPRL